MIVWRTYVKTIITNDILSTTEKSKVYKMLLLFGFIPLFISIDG